MEYLINLAILFCIYGMLALSLNMVVGMAGLLSLAQAAFYGIGAYACAIGMVSLGLGFFSALLLGIAVNGVLAFIVGKILSRFQGDYYAIVSSGLSIIVFAVFLNWKSLTNGSLGIFGIPRPEVFGHVLSSGWYFLLLSLTAAGAAYVCYTLIERSSFGRTLKAIREDEQLTRSLGYNTKHYKSIIFVLSAIMSGIAGALFASYIAFIEPGSFRLKEGIFLFTIIIIGGLSSAKGSIVGALVLISLSEILRFIGLPDETAAQLQQIIYGSLLVLFVVIRPQGLFGKYRM